MKLVVAANFVETSCMVSDFLCCFLPVSVSVINASFMLLSYLVLHRCLRLSWIYGLHWKKYGCHC